MANAFCYRTLTTCHGTTALRGFPGVGTVVGLPYKAYKFRKGVEKGGTSTVRRGRTTVAPLSWRISNIEPVDDSKLTFAVSIGSARVMLPYYKL